MILEIIVICILGTLLHFTYEWSNHNTIVGLFSAVNESTWEHIKMCLTAIFLCSIVDGLFLGSNPNYFYAKFISLIMVIVLIPLLHYGYTFITKKHIPIIDIIIFYLVIVISQLSFYKILALDELPYIYSYIGLIGSIIIFGSYLLLTLLPLKNFLFIDPINNKYGFKGHKEHK